MECQTYPSSCIVCARFSDSPSSVPSTEKLNCANLCLNGNPVRYDERNGTAMFVVSLGFVQNDFELIIEFQGGTYKVCLLHKDYMKKNSYNHKNKLYGTWDKINNTWNGPVYKEFEKLQTNNWKIAISKNLGKNIGKPRIALDKNIGSDWYNNTNNQFFIVYKEAKDLSNVIKNKVTSIP